MSQETLKMNYCYYFHSIVNYRLIFRGNSSYSNNIFRLRERIIRIIISTRIKDCCIELLKI